MTTGRLRYFYNYICLL